MIASLASLFSRVTGLAVALATFAAVPAEAYDFGPFPKCTSPQEVGPRIVENFLPRWPRLTPQDGTIHYAEACTWYGALTFARLAGRPDLTEKIIRRYDPLLLPEYQKIVPDKAHVDWEVWGIVTLEIYLQTKDEKYRAPGLMRADRQWENPIEGGMSPQTRYWIDDMYMISAIQTQAYRATGNPVYLERIALQMVPYLEKLQQPNGLFFHGMSAEKGRFYWGRGNGWMAAGMTELLREVPKTNPHYPRILEGYRKMMAALLAAQGPDGMWRQLLDVPEAWPETSGTAMFTFAFITGVKNGWLDAETYGPAARKAWLALVQNYIDENGNVRDVCQGMGQRVSVEAYLAARKVLGDYHGQAPILWCASALLR
jgi:unsaturated rhamnogalacturonyl hydrolase